MADQALNIGIVTTADTSGLDKTKVSADKLDLSVKQVQLDAQKLGTTNTVGNIGGQLDAMSSKLDIAKAKFADFRALTEAGGQSAGSSASAALGGGIAGDAAAGATEAISAALGGFAIALGGAVAAGYGLKVLLETLTTTQNETTTSLDHTGEAYTDFLASLNKEIITSKDLATARRQGKVDLDNYIGSLERENQVNSRSADKLDASFAPTADIQAQALRTKIDLNNQIIAQAAKIRADLNDYAQKLRDSGQDDAHQTQQKIQYEKDFHDAAFASLAPLAQQTVVAQSFNDQLAKAKADLLSFPNGAALGVTPQDVASLKTATDLFAYSNTLRGGAARLAREDADGLLKTEQLQSQITKDLQDQAKVNADLIKNAQTKKQSDQDALDLLDKEQVKLDLEVSKGVQTESSRASQAAAQLSIGDRRKKLTDDIALQEAITLDTITKQNAALKQQTDLVSANLIKTQGLGTNQEALTAASKTQSKITGDNPAYQAFQSDVSRQIGADQSALPHQGQENIVRGLLPDLATILGQGRPEGGGIFPVGAPPTPYATSPGDTDNPFGSMLPEVNAAVKAAQQEAVTALGQVRDAAVTAITDLQTAEADAFGKILAAVLALKAQGEKQSRDADQLGTDFSAALENIIP